MVAALQSAVIGYGLERHYQTFSRTWMAVKTVFNLLKSKLKKEEVEEVEEVEEKQKKGKEIRLKIRNSSLKRFGANTINCVC